jgi:sulfur carrier protein
VVSITVNGSTYRFETHPSVAALLAELGLVGKRIAVERNGDIVPRSHFEEQTLADGDRLEIVVAVGGG